MPLGLCTDDEKIRSISKRIGIVFAVIILLNVELFSCIGTYFSWADHHRASQFNKTRFIGSSDIVQLECWPKNAVQSVAINTTSIILYSSDQQDLESVIYFRELNISKSTRPDLDSYKKRFQVYYHDPPEGLFTVHEGYIEYYFTVELNKDEMITADVCTLEIFTFDSYFEFSKYLTDTAERTIPQYFDRMCLKTEDKVGDLFVVNFTLPAQQFTYIAGIANSNVKVLSYYASAGLVAAYNISRLDQKKCQHDDGDDDCLVTIGGRYAGIFNQHKRLCVFVRATQVPNESPYVYVATKVLKAYIVAVIITSVAVASLMLLGCICLVLCYKTRVCGALINKPQQVSSDEQPTSTSQWDDTASDHDHDSTQNDEENSLLLKSPIDEQGAGDRSHTSSWFISQQSDNTTKTILPTLRDETTCTDVYSVEGKND